MFSKTFSALLLASTAVVTRAALTVTAPNSVVQCKDAVFTITEATGQLYFTVLPAQNSCESDPFAEIGPLTLTGDSYTWHPTNVTTGVELIVLVDDGSDAEAWSNTFTVTDEGACATDTTLPSGTGAADDSDSGFNVNSAHSSSRTSPTDTPENAAETPSNAAGLSASVNKSVVALFALVGAFVYSL